MEIESSNTAPIMSNKLWNKVQIALYMLRKTLTKTKLLVDLHIRLKDGQLARKAFTTPLLQHHYTAIRCGGCTSNNIDRLVISPQKHKLQSSHDSSKIERVVFEMSNNGCVAIEPPLLQGLSAAVSGEDEEVDKAAEAFINNFYKQLRQQHITCVESPSPNHLWAQ
ncbi:hypothetical protein SSX86_022858 [Deinandra increscens subsp. villosa]|uniref:Uncharacterized protein n=1 Tax=Deinandra increscens subsp. villosa TaxID=3103831 RepID=A0AAP0GPF4_9ASTR